MTDEDLRKMSRVELLEMLIELSKKNDSLIKQNKELKRQLEDKYITINNAGSIAEAALQLNGVFSAAQDAAQQYLDNIKELSRQQEEKLKNMQKSGEI